MHFFDDQGLLCFGGEEYTAQQYTADVYELAGRPFNWEKHLAPSQKQLHLGLINDFTELELGHLTLHPKPAKREQAMQDFDRRWKAAYISQKEVAQSLGDINHLSSSCFGEIEKGGIQALRRAAAAEGPVRVEGCFKQSLNFFRCVLASMRSRKIPVSPHQQHVAIYSDAAWEQDEWHTFTGLGGVCRSENTTRAAAGEALQNVLDALRKRERRGSSRWNCWRLLLHFGLFQTSCGEDSRFCGWIIRASARR